MQISGNVHFTGISSRTERIFENLWELREGVTFNSYLVCGDRPALIDACPAGMFSALRDNIERTLPLSKVSYLVLNHLEPDHTGAVREIKAAVPGIEVLTTKKGAEMLASFYGLREGVREVRDGETVDLGGASLRFVGAPFLHWPETMMTFEEVSGVLFSCDCFGGFGAFPEGGIFAGEGTERVLHEELFRYFVNVMSGYARHIERTLPKVASIRPRVIAPSHGLLHRDPEKILESYGKWCGYSSGKCDDYIPVVASTMYGMTLEGAGYVAEGIRREGFETGLFDLSKDTPSYVLGELYRARGVALASPTYEGGLFPLATDLLVRARAKEIKGRKAMFLGSSAWAGGARKEFLEWCEKLSWECVEAFEFKGAPAPHSADLRDLGSRFARSIPR